MNAAINYQPILYLIIILLWAVYKYYQKSQKVKNISEKKPSPDSQLPTPNYKSIFEKILLGEEFSAPAKTKDNEVTEIEEVKINNSNYQRKTNNEQRTTNSEQQIIPPEAMGTLKGNADAREGNAGARLQRVPAELNTKHQTLNTKFSLKQAIIYSVILNRPYQ